MKLKLLPQIEAWLSTHRPDYFALLNPPAHDYLFEALRATAGIELPDDVKSFYQWHDGQQARTFDPLLENLTFMTLMEIATTHCMHRQVAAVDQWTEEHWQPCWVPFLSNGGGDYLCIATESFRHIPAGSVIWYDHEVSEREVVHQDLESFLCDLYDRMSHDRLELG